MSIRNRTRSNAWLQGCAKVAALAFAGGMLVACSSDPEPQIPDTPVEVLYNNAKDALQEGEARR
ncbi:MAG: hypothetical protein JNL25_18415, partial [Rhodospirillaceae bacterium]|nr:hypothetical protein [Rhodospirillaceae bacterium]